MLSAPEMKKVEGLKFALCLRISQRGRTMVEKWNRVPKAFESMGNAVQFNPNQLNSEHIRNPCEKGQALAIDLSPYQAHSVSFSTDLGYSDGVKNRVGFGYRVLKIDRWPIGATGQGR